MTGNSDVLPERKRLSADFLSIYLSRYLESSSSSSSSAEKRILGLAVDGEVYERFLRTAPWRRAGETLTALMAFYLDAYENRPPIVQQTLNLNISAEPHSVVTVNAEQKAEAPLNRAERQKIADWAAFCLEKWNPYSAPKIREQLGRDLIREPRLREIESIQRLMQKLEMTE